MLERMIEHIQDNAEMYLAIGGYVSLAIPAGLAAYVIYNRDKLKHVPENETERMLRYIEEQKSKDAD